MRKVDKMGKSGKMDEILELVKTNPVKASDEFVRFANSIFDIQEAEKLLEVGERVLNALERAEGKEGKDIEHQRGRIYGTLGNLHYFLGNFERAEENYMKALHVYIELSKRDEKYMGYVGGALYNLGNLYQIRRKFEEAEKAYTDAMDVFKITGDKKQLANVLVSLATLHAKIGENEKAEKEFIQAFEMKKGGDVREIGIVLNNLAVIYLREGRKKEAEILLNKALEIFENTEFSEELASVMQNLLSLFSPLEIDDRILEKIDKIENLPPDLKAKVEFLKAKRFEKMGENRKAAESYLNAACFSFIAYRNFGLQSVNFVHCFEKAEELGVEKAKAVKSAVLRFYMGASVSVDMDELERLGDESGVLGDVARMVFHDSKLSVKSAGKKDKN